MNYVCIYVHSSRIFCDMVLASNFYHSPLVCSELIGHIVWNELANC